MSQGYFFIALGQRYIQECSLLAKTIRKQGDDRPISLLVFENDIQFAKQYDLFDQFVVFDVAVIDDIWKDCSTGFEKYCLYPRLNFDEYIPYDETIIVDSDVLCQFNPDHVWSYMSKRHESVGMLGRRSDSNWHWGQINKVSAAYGKHVPHVHGGFFYLRKGPFLKEFFDYAKDVFWNYDRYNCQRAFRGGRVDEIIFAITHAYFNMFPVEFDEYPVMTFNYEPTVEIPSKLQTESGQNIEMSNYIPFIHMFDKMEGNNFMNLYNKIIDYEV